jgi:5-methylthioadenosine/S-adenosylhomocysteine deaminase
VSAALAFELATIRGAEAIGMADRIGSLESGKKADVVVHRTDVAGWMPRGDVALQLVWGTDGRSVRDVLVDGRFVVRDGVVLTVDVADLHERAAVAQRELLARSRLTVPHAWPHLLSH